MASRAIPILIADLSDSSPLIRALALRTMSAIPVREFFEAALERLSDALQDHDPYVRKTAAYSVAKLWNHDPKAVEEKGFINELNNLLSNSNPTVVAAALAALSDISEKTPDLQLTIDRTHAFNLGQVLPDCNEWSQIYILSALMNYVPQTSSDAVIMIERVTPRLQHANSSVVLGTIRLIVYLSNYVADLSKSVPNLDRKIGPAFVILLQKPPEIQYLALRNCILLLQSRPQLLNLDVKVFLCKYNDPIYVKATKLEIIFLLASESNIRTVLRELRECATEIDVQVVRKAVRAIGKLAIKIERAAEACLEALMDLVSTNVSYIVQEATVVIKNIFRRYPNRYERVISVLCEHLDSLDEPEAKAAMIWIIGNYADRIDNADELLENFLSTFKEDTVEVQLALLTAIVKLFIARPSKAQALVPKVLGWATEESDNPDVRDRGYMYWRLLSADPKAAKRIVAGEMPLITTDSDRMDDDRLEELELCIGSLATIYLKPVKQIFRLAKVRTLPESPALAPRVRQPKLLTQKSTPNLLTRASTLNSLGSQTTGWSASNGQPPLVRAQTLSHAMGNMSLNRANSVSQLPARTLVPAGSATVQTGVVQQQQPVAAVQTQATETGANPPSFGQFQRQQSMPIIQDPMASFSEGTAAPFTSANHQLNSFGSGMDTGHGNGSGGFLPLAGQQQFQTQHQQMPLQSMPTTTAGANTIYGSAYDSQNVNGSSAFVNTATLATSSASFSQSDSLIDANAAAQQQQQQIPQHFQYQSYQQIQQPGGAVFGQQAHRENASAHDLLW